MDHLVDLKMTYGNRLFWVVIILLISADQTLKMFFLRWHQEAIYIHVLKPWEIFLRLATVITVLAVFIVHKKKSENSLSKDKDSLVYVGIALIIAGGLSNIIDLIVQKGVVDIFKIPTLYFNGADGLIVAGALLFLVKVGNKLLSNRFSCSNTQ